MQPKHILLLRRVLIIVFIVFLGAVVQSYYSRSRRRVEEGTAGQILTPDIKRATEGIQFSEHRDGRALFKVSAQKLVETRAARNILQTVEALNFGNDGTRKDSIQSDYCEYDQANDVIVFNGNVLVTVQGGTEIRSNALRYEKSSDTVKTSERFTIKDRGIHGEGIGLRYRFSAQSFVIDKQVKLHIRNPESKPTPAPPAETIIQAESAVYDHAHHHLRFVGNVSALQENGELRSAALDIHFGPGDQQIEYLEANQGASYKMGAMSGPSPPSELQGDTIRMYFQGGAGAPDRIETRGRGSFRSQTAQRRDVLNAERILITLVENQLHDLAAHGGAILSSVSSQNQMALGADKLTAGFAGQGSAALDTLTLEGHAHFKSLEGREATSALQAGRIMIRFASPTAGQGIKELTAAERVDWQLTKLAADPLVVKEKKAPTDANQRRLRSENLRVVYQDDGVHVRELRALEHCQVELVPGKDKPERTQINAERMDITFRANTDQMEKVFAEQTVKVITKSVDRSSSDRVTASDRLTADFKPDGQLQAMLQEGHFQFMEGKRKGKSDRARYEESTELLYLLGHPKIEEEGSTTSADEMVVNRKLRILQAAGDVRTRQYGNAAQSVNSPFTASKEPTFITARSLELHDKEGVAIYRGNAWVRQENNYVHAMTVEVDNAKQQLIARTNVTSRTQFAGDGGNGAAGQQPTTVHADLMHFHQKDQRIRYEKNVRLLQKGSEIIAETADLFLAGTDNRVEKAFFKNRVFIKQPEREGRGDEAEYYAKEDKIILVGNLAQVDSKSKGKSIGKRLTIFNNGDKIFIESR
ncbi:MAG: LPS export ABC transporter periplasmic protein LptC [Acidobacteria bacterium]|nr:LPS export ABC transporter periplasmic protein LptC [Acidobacteriota bacterium]MBI3656581.1 LPS export ABC transporter periplasmic protein LptC [Acidobacteriota bacterium]